MTHKVTITDLAGYPIKKGSFSQPELRMAAKAGYRLFEDGAEITQHVTQMFEYPASGQDFQ